MGQNCRCVNINNDDQLPSIQSREKSFMKKSHQYLQLMEILIPGGDIQIVSSYQLMFFFMLKDNKGVYEDSQFYTRQAMKDQETNDITSLFDLEKRHVQSVYVDQQTRLDIFDQRQIKLTYLSAVFYEICKNVQIKRAIFTTKKVNRHKCYVLKLFVNGKEKSLVVDDKIIVEKQKIKYLYLQKVKQIWPFLLQKAWCKLIGSYTKAKSLSAADCYQQIIGAPATSLILSQYSIEQVNEIILRILDKNYWAVFVAKKFNEELIIRNEQIFHLQSIDIIKKVLYLRSPFLIFGNAVVKQFGDRTGCLAISYRELYDLFDYITIGYYQKGYILKSFPIGTSSKDNPSQISQVFQIRVMEQVDINIRFIQPYSQYMGNEEKQPYFPIVIQLYSENCKLVQDCEGTIQNLIGVKSSSISRNAFVSLKQGIYYLRLKPGQRAEKQLNQCNLVFYLSKECEIQSKADLFDHMILNRSLESSETEIILNQIQKLKIYHKDQSFKNIIKIENISGSIKRLQVTFPSSQNIKILHPQQKDGKVIVSLDKNQYTIIQVFPEDPTQDWILRPFDIISL